MTYQNLSVVELVKHCADGEPQAWQEFLRRFRRPIALAVVRALRRTGSFAPAIIDDLLQDIFVSLCANDYAQLRTLVAKYPDTLDDMLLRVASNATYDYLRAKTSQKRGGKHLHLVEPDTGVIEQIPARDRSTKIEQEVQLDEIDRLLQRSADTPSGQRDQRIFWLHFQMGMSTESIARIPSVGLTPKGVESSILRTLKFIRKSFRIDRH
jgi:RNA polymerase sigma-70 factor (ECF subfamily)